MAGLVVLGVVTAVLAIGITFFAVKYFKSKRGSKEHGSDAPYYENQSGGNSPQYENYPYDGNLHNGSKPDAMNSTSDNIPFENPDDLNLPHPADNSPHENHGDLNLNSPTDNSPYENPEAVTSEYLSEPGSTTENSHALAGHYENVNGRGNQYEAIHMSDISATVNPYEEIRHWIRRKHEW